MIVSSSHDTNEARSQTKEYLETIDGAVHRCVGRTQKLLERSVGLSAAVAVSAYYEVVVLVVVWWENDPHARYIYVRSGMNIVKCIVRSLLPLPLSRSFFHTHTHRPPPLVIWTGQ